MPTATFRSTARCAELLGGNSRQKRSIERGLGVSVAVDPATGAIEITGDAPALQRFERLWLDWETSRVEDLIVRVRLDV